MRLESFVFLTIFIFGVLALDYCGPNTMRTSCGNLCEKTCGQIKSRHCSNKCEVDRCVCKPGYIRRDENGPCILRSWCRMVAEKWEWEDWNASQTDS